MIQSTYKTDRNQAVYDAVENGIPVKDIAAQFSISYKRVKDIHYEHKKRLAFFSRV